MVKILKGLAITIIACALLLVSAYGYFFVTGSILPNVFVNGVNVGFQSQRQAATQLSSTTSGFDAQSITILTKNKKLTLQVSDVAYITDVSSVVQEAYQFGRNGGFFDNFASFFDIVFNGRSLPLAVTVDEDLLREKIVELASTSMQSPTPRQYVIKNGQLLIDGGKPGTMVDVEATIAVVKEKIETFDWSNISAPYTEIAAPPIDLAQAWTVVTTEPVDAYYDVDLKEVVPAVDGVSFDLESAKASINLSSTEIQAIPLTYTPAAVQADDLIALLFQDTLGTFKTYFGSHSSNRGINICLCAESINETVVQPGEVFSFNDSRSEATPENGYKKAGVFENGRTVQGYGGGVCQVSSTLYAAALYANMETVERYNHMFMVSYMDISMDATVYSPTLDFKFRNTSPYPIKVITETKNGYLTVSIVGTKTDDIEVVLSPKRVSSSDGTKKGELWKTVTINGVSTTTRENTSSYKG